MHNGECQQQTCLLLGLPTLHFKKKKKKGEENLQKNL